MSDERECPRCDTGMLFPYEGKAAVRYGKRMWECCICFETVWIEEEDEEVEE